jgi:hypothetical protein
MNCHSVKFKVVKNPQSQDLQLEIYRPYGDDDKHWMMIDRLNDLTIEELKCLTEYLLSLFKKPK